MVTNMILSLSSHRQEAEPGLGLSSCEHRSVSKDGRIVCKKIVEGDTPDGQVSPNVCRACPFKAVNCAHLRFSLSQHTPTPLIVRFNGRTEVWDDESPEVKFEQAACAAKVTPIQHPKQCTGCALRQPCQTPAQQVPRRGKAAAASGKVVTFPSRERAAATG
jgi:hypothetical protein